MAFNLYKKYRLEDLAGLFAGKVFARTQTPQAAWQLLTPHIVIVQTRGMADYLKQKLAADHGIAANLELPLVNSFINSLMRKIYAKEFIASEKASELKNMRKKLMQRLSDPEFIKKHVPELNKYLCEPNKELKRWQLAGKIAELFDQYQIYRAWELEEVLSNTSVSWQQMLYRELFTIENPGREHFFRRFLSEELTEKQRQSLPEEISLFGISSLPPVFLDIFIRLSEYCKINFFYLAPCEEYWEYQLSQPEIRRLKAWDIAEAGNPILQALGRQGRGFFSALMSHDVIAEKLYPENILEPDDYPPESSMLEIMQYDILHLFDRREVDDPYASGNELVGTPRHDLKDDRSIVIHNCHNTRREIEVLHDELIKLINQGIEPREITVMAPDIAGCAPMIDAVFGNGPLRDVYTIADMQLSDNATVTETFFRILETASGRFEYSAVMSLLDMPLLQNKLRIDSSTLSNFGNILQTAGVRWGFDGNMHAKFGGSAFAEFSWRSAIDRLLAGYTNRPEGGINTPVMIGNTSAVQYLEEAGIEAFARLADLLEKLHSLSQELDKLHTLDFWHELFSGILQDFFPSDNFTTTALVPLRQALDEMLVMHQEGCTPNLYLLNTATAILQDLWSEPLSIGKFLRGKITFCRMMPMRSIPMKVTALLDLNEGDFPRRTPSDGFDLIAADPLPGDRSAAVQDRYLLLEALLATRRNLLLFYQGQNAFNNQPMPACAPLNEIASYLKNAFGLTEYKHKVTGIDPSYFTEDAKFASFDKDNFDALQYLRKPPIASIKPQFPEEFIGMKAAENLYIDDLVDFFNSPAHWYLNSQIGVRFQNSYNDSTDSEPWSLSGLDQWQIKSLAMQMQLTDPQPVSDEKLFQYARSGNLLPPGEVGRQAFFQQIDLLKKLPDFWVKNLQTQQRMPVICQHRSLPCKICGMINVSSDNGTVLSYRQSRYDSRTALPAVLGVLTSSIALDKPVGAQILNITSAGCELRCIQPVHPADALKKLQQLLKIATQNCKIPPPVFQKSSPLYATAYKAQTAFYGKYNDSGDASDPAVRMFYSPEDWDQSAFQEQFNFYAALLYDMIEKSKGSPA